jgi:hypothetical protein
MAAFHLGLTFGLVLLPCNTFSTLDAAGRQSTLERTYAHLRPGGIFAASLPNPVQLRQASRQSAPEVEETFLHPVDGEPVQVSSAWKRSSRDFQLTWIYDHLLPDGRVERHCAQVRHSLVGMETYLEELQQAGLKILHLFGDFDRSPFDGDSPNLILVAAKKWLSPIIQR